MWTKLKRATCICCWLKQLKIIIRTSSLGDPGGVVGLAAVLSPTVAVTVVGDLEGDLVTGGDFIGVLSFSLIFLLSSLPDKWSSYLSLESDSLSEGLSLKPLSLMPEPKGPLSALLSLLNGLSWALSALSGTRSEGAFSDVWSILSESRSGCFGSTLTTGLSTLGSGRGSWGRWLTSVKKPYKLMVILLYHPRNTTTSVAPWQQYNVQSK